MVAAPILCATGQLDVLLYRAIFRTDCIVNILMVATIADLSLIAAGNRNVQSQVGEDPGGQLWPMTLATLPWIVRGVPLSAKTYQSDLYLCTQGETKWQ
jgi:hypothetical protein